MCCIPNLVIVIMEIILICVVHFTFDADIIRWCLVGSLGCVGKKTFLKLVERQVCGCVYQYMKNMLLLVI
jgi:hypothetical protein